MKNSIKKYFLTLGQKDVLVKSSDLTDMVTENRKEALYFDTKKEAREFQLTLPEVFQDLTTIQTSQKILLTQKEFEEMYDQKVEIH